jgi:hypothetical protein
MTLDETREKMDLFWESADREALELKDSYLALDRLHTLYHGLDSSERELADQVVAEWLLSGEEAKRFDAVALIRDFKIASAVPALQRLADELDRSDDPGARFEREKVDGLLAELTSRGPATT